MSVGLLGMLLVVGSSLAVEDRGEAELDRFEFRETHMGSEFTILIYCNDGDLASSAARSAFARIAFLDETLSDYKVDSELMRLSDEAGGPPVPVSPELFEVLARSRALSEQTDGAFDATINPVVKLWRRARRNRELPSRSQLEEALGRIGWQGLELDAEARTVRLARPGMRLDVGGIAKGYASDAALAVLRDSGITRALVAGAGDIVVGDPPPGRSGWIIGIASIDAEEQGGARRFLSMRNQAVSTSGDAERFVEIDGVRYSHIVDPRTGLGLTGRSSVTVVARDGTTSDSLATALSVLGPQRGLELAEEAEGVEALIVAAEDGQNRYQVDQTSGFEAMLTERPDVEEPVTSLGPPES
ncbi:FAD:protein FMN transferase [Tautonia rosea]|uniref:FAD:protein FMN transferase n=1 Tax=Tautonia rosea TaxID=2728037 RepID=UPI0019D1C38D|nr:FAD:protein FMN transferase [Tautonia rosea]